MSTGVHVEGATMPRPSLDHQLTTACGVLKRFCKAPPRADPEFLKRFSGFVRKWVKDNMIPLSSGTDLTLETWLGETSYTEGRKNELRQLSKENLDPWKKKYWKCKSFVKDEFYPSFKHARSINSRHDVMKLAFGPAFRAIEKQLFSRPEFIKKIPASERPAYIMELFGERDPSAKYIATDYTAFESLFTRELMESCEFVLYDHMLSQVEGGLDKLALMRAVMLGKNVCGFKSMNVEVKATRMSGEMNTSLGNGFTNLMALLFLCHEKGSEVKCVIEGDDGLAKIMGPCPTSEDYLRLGLEVKLEVHDAIENASFCGMVFDTEDLVTISDPNRAFLTMGWSSKEYVGARDGVLMNLLRMKALSFHSIYSGCPMIGALAYYILNVTKRCDISKVRHAGHMGVWMHERMNELVDTKSFQYKEPPMRTRLLFAKLYGYSVERQLLIERELLGRDRIAPIPLDWLHGYSSDCTNYWNMYVARIRLGENENCPGIAHPIVNSLVPLTDEHLGKLHGPVTNVGN